MVLITMFIPSSNKQKIAYPVNQIPYTNYISSHRGYLKPNMPSYIGFFYPLHIPLATMLKHQTNSSEHNQINMLTP